ncbi:hypothetical protein D3C81_1126590 [compost metagenome]
MHVHVDAGIQLLGQHAHALETVVADRVGRVRAEGDLDPRVVAQVGEQLEAAAQCLVGVVGAGHREIQHRNGDLRAHAAGVHHFAGHLGEEVHVGEGADAALDLLGDGQLAAVANEVGAHPLGLGRPDVFLQPGHQRQVVGEAAEQAHRRVAVGVDQPGGEQHAGQFAALAGGHGQRLLARGEQGDAAVADAQRVVAQHHPGRFHRDYPFGEQEQVQGGGGAGHVRGFRSGGSKACECSRWRGALEAAVRLGKGYTWRLFPESKR